MHDRNEECLTIASSRAWSQCSVGSSALAANSKNVGGSLHIEAARFAKLAKRGHPGRPHPLRTTSILLRSSGEPRFWTKQCSIRDYANTRYRERESVTFLVESAGGGQTCGCKEMSGDLPVPRGTQLVLTDIHSTVLNVQSKGDSWSSACACFAMIMFCGRCVSLFRRNINIRLKRSP